MKEKERKGRKRVPSDTSPPLTSAAAATSPAPSDQPPVRRKVRFAPDTKNVTRLSDDDFLRAFGGELGHVLHIDHAHSIAIGEKGERYYLMMVVDGVDFLWATPSRHTSTPECVIEDFIRNTGVTVDKIRCDDATVSCSDSFKEWCRSSYITICATAGYNHTLQARAEGAIRIAKEHV